MGDEWCNLMYLLKMFQPNPSSKYSCYSENVLIIFVLLNSIAQYLFKKYESIIEVHMSKTLIPLFLWKYYWKYNSFEMLWISFGRVSFNYNVRRFLFFLFFTYLDSASNNTLTIKRLFSTTIFLPLFLFNCLFGGITICNFNNRFLPIQFSELWLEAFSSHYDY